MRSLQFFLLDSILDGKIVVVAVGMDFFMFDADLIF